MPKTQTCYCCDSPATGKEHAPMKSLFPPEYRTNMITVPSCDKHNGEKKKDDEFFKHVIASGVEDSEPGMITVNSVVRSFKYSPALQEAFMPNARRVKINGKETIGFTVDGKRFNRSARYLVRALHFHETGVKNHKEIEIQWRRFYNRNLDPNSLSPILIEFENLWPESDYKGLHPEIFRYDFHTLRAINGNFMTICRMQFHKGPPIIGIWHDRENK